MAFIKLIHSKLEILDFLFDWVEYINACTNKLTSALCAIYRVNDYRPISALTTIYYTWAYGNLTYGIILWVVHTYNSLHEITIPTNIPINW